jgi:serine/threonine-protein kinase HipA
MGIDLGLTPKQINRSFNRMIKNKPKALNWIDRSFLSLDMKTEYRVLLEQRYRQLGFSDL